MNKNMILTLAKGLKTFSTDDILMMSELQQDDTLNILSSLETEGILIKINEDEYKYQPKQQNSIPKLIQKHQNTNEIKNNITFNQATAYFLINHSKINCTISTHQGYKSIIQGHLSPFFKETKLKDISIKDLERFVQLKHSEGLSNKRINACVTLLGNMFKKFIQWQYLKESPYNGVINVKFEKLNKIQTLNENEQELLLKKAKYTYKNVYPLIQIILNTGLKKSEILALKKEDINFENRKIYVYKTVFENTILKTKFKSAIREVDIPENLINLFKELTKKKEDYIFLKSGSSFITVDKIIRKEFSALLIHAKIQKIAFKELRHTFARNSLQKGISIDYLHKQLGEYSIQATMDKYGEFITKIQATC